MQVAPQLMAPDESVTVPVPVPLFGDGERQTRSSAVPDRVADSAPELIWRVADLAPWVVGTNRTATLQLDMPARGLPLQPSAPSANSPVAVPAPRTSDGRERGARDVAAVGDDEGLARRGAGVEEGDGREGEARGRDGERRGREGRSR